MTITADSPAAGAAVPGGIRKHVLCRAPTKFESPQSLIRQGGATQVERVTTLRAEVPHSGPKSGVISTNVLPSRIGGGELVYRRAAKLKENSPRNGLFRI